MTIETTERHAATLASRLTRFRECVDAIPDVAARLAQGQQFNAYGSALNDEDAADEDCTMYLSIGSIDDRRSIVTVEGRAEADMIAHALTFASLASVLSASAGYTIEQGRPAATAPYACSVLAGRFVEDVGDWEMAVVLTPLVKPFTHWWPLPSSEPVPATNQAAEVAELRQVLRHIAEGNLGDAPWQCNYSLIKEVAAAALATQPATSQEVEGTLANPSTFGKPTFGLAATPTPPAGADEVLRKAVAKLLPIGNDRLPGDRVIAIYVRMDELRALHALSSAQVQA